MPTATRSPTRHRLAARARLFRALSDETRLAVLELLRGGEQCVCDLQDALDAAQSRLSFHLRVLKEAGLVRDRKDGRWSFYALDPAAAGEIEAYARHLATPRPANVGAPVLHQLTRGRRPAGKVAKDPGDCCP